MVNTMIVSLLVISAVILMIVILIKIKKNDYHWLFKTQAVGAVIGMITDFLDTLGIGSFVTTTTLFQMTNYLDDERNLPGTLNLSHAIPTIVEALFFVTAVRVQPITLISMVAAAVIGSVVGSEIVVRLNKSTIQKTMAVALVITSILMIINKLGWISLIATDNSALGLTGGKLLVGVIGNFVLGILMAAGVGLYAPCMVLVYFLGLKPIAAFPIMMLSCALLMPAVSLNFIRKDRYSLNGIFGFILGGIVGVVIAATLVRSLSLSVLGWLIVVVSFWTAFQLWRSSLNTV